MLNQLPIFIAGFPVQPVSQDMLTKTIFERMKLAKQTILFFANTNFIVKCRPQLKRMLNENVIIVNDGIGMDVASMLLYRKKFKFNLNGTDFMPFFFTKTKRPLRVFLLGAKADVLNKAAFYLEKKLNQQAVGLCDGFEEMGNTDKLVERINHLNVDVVLVALGNPKQEEWILNNAHRLNAQFISGVGALFDFWAGDKPRAPVLVQRLRLEWLYRLCHEPKRLLKRYTVDILVFLMICLKH